MNEQILMDLVARIQNRFFGKYRGTVTQVDEDTPRIKAKVPAVLGDEQETGWCTPCVPFAGDDEGIAFLPDVGAGVWIEFEGGDVSFPIWSGCYWHDGEVPKNVGPKVRVIKTKGKQHIELHDDDHTITITDANENTITLDNNGITITRGKGNLVIGDESINANNGAMEVLPKDTKPSG